MKGLFGRHYNAKYQNPIDLFQKDIALAKSRSKSQVKFTKLKVPKARCLDGDSITRISKSYHLPSKPLSLG
jgi:hypothetical protein